MKISLNLINYCFIFSQNFFVFFSFYLKTYYFLKNLLYLSKIDWVLLYIYDFFLINYFEIRNGNRKFIYYLLFIIILIIIIVVVVINFKLLINT